MADSDPSDGSFQLNNVGFGSYIINEIMPPEGYDSILLKTRVAVLPTKQNLVVTIENRNINVFFEGTAIVTPPSLNATAFESFVRNGASVGNLSIKEVDALPSGLIETTETEETEVRQENRDIQEIRQMITNMAVPLYWILSISQSSQ